MLFSCISAFSKHPFNIDTDNRTITRAKACKRSIGIICAGGVVTFRNGHVTMRRSSHRSPLA